MGARLSVADAVGERDDEWEAECRDGVRLRVCDRDCDADTAGLLDRGCEPAADGDTAGVELAEVLSLAVADSDVDCDGDGVVVSVVLPEPDTDADVAVTPLPAGSAPVRRARRGSAV